MLPIQIYIYLSFSFVLRVLTLEVARLCSRIPSTLARTLVSSYLSNPVKRRFLFLFFPFFLFGVWGGKKKRGWRPVGC